MKASVLCFYNNYWKFLASIITCNLLISLSPTAYGSQWQVIVRTGEQQSKVISPAYQAVNYGWQAWDSHTNWHNHCSLLYSGWLAASWAAHQQGCQKSFLILRKGTRLRWFKKLTQFACLKCYYAFVAFLYALSADCKNQNKIIYQQTVKLYISRSKQSTTSIMKG